MKPTVTFLTSHRRGSLRESFLLSALLFVALASPLAASPDHWGGCNVAILVDGVERPEYFHNGTTYIEALRGREYTIRLSNPNPYRVAVALSVDGLNSIDAKRTTAKDASKWVLDAYESAEIKGWQTSESHARRFYFTSEEDSYGAALGKTKNLGVIEAVCFRERPRVIQYEERRPYSKEGARDSVGAAPEASAAPPPTAQRRRQESDDYAATGMGDRTRHDVMRVDLDLEPHPISSTRLRYEFRPQLVKLGVLPRHHHSPLDRRERARGFEGFCPEP